MTIQREGAGVFWPVYWFFWVGCKNICGFLARHSLLNDIDPESRCWFLKLNVPNLPSFSSSGRAFFLIFWREDLDLSLIVCKITRPPKTYTWSTGILYNIVYWSMPPKTSQNNITKCSRSPFWGSLFSDTHTPFDECNVDHGRNFGIPQY